MLSGVCEFTSLLGCASVWPLAAHAQRGEPMWRVGVLLSTGDGDPQERSQLAAFVQRLMELGWVDSHNARLEVCWTADSVDAARKYAAELVALAPDSIVTDTSFNVAISRKRFPPGLTSRTRRDTRYRATGTKPCGGNCCCGPAVRAGCITFFTTYSPILSPISVPTRVEKR
jgi:hypothetical protein